MSRVSRRRSVPAIAARLACAFLAFGLSTLAVTLAARTGQSADDDKARNVFTRTCVKCHTPERIVGERRTRAQWEEEFDKMVAKGATATDEDFDTVLDYLLRHYGRANVNTAPAADLVLVLQISGKDAGAIVSYRKAHGRYEDFDALAKVPGIDLDRLTGAGTPSSSDAPRAGNEHPASGVFR